MRQRGRLGRCPARLASLDRFVATLSLTLAAYLAFDGLASAQTASAQTPQPAQQAQPAAPKGATPATVLDDKDVETVLGKEIYSGKGEDMGKIVDVLVDHAGQVRAAIIDFGGFLGVGSRNIAVDWRAIHFAPDAKSDRIVLSLTRDEVRVAPEYKPGEPIVVLGSANATEPTVPANPPPEKPAASK